MATPIFLTPDAPSSPDHVLLGLVVVAAVFLIPIILSRRPKVSLRYGWGWVYVFRDVHNPQLLKVGRTRRSTNVRMDEVSETMTGGAQLEQIYAVKVPYVVNVEEFAHANLRQKRHWSERGTEWFKTDPRTAIRAVDAAAKNVRKIARRQRKWSEQADRDSSRWRLTRNGPVIARLFGRW